MTSLNLSAWALKHRALVLFAIIALTLAGIQSFAKLGRSEDPAFLVRAMVITAEWPGATAREVQEQVTDELEKTLQEVPWFDFVTSISRPGASIITLTLRQDAPKEAVADGWYQVRKRITDMKGRLPQGVRGPFFNDDFGDTFGNIYAFSADGFTPAELKQYVEAARQKILSVPGVAKVNLVGAQEERIYVEFAHQRISLLGISTNSLIEGLRKQTAVVPFGVVEAPDERVVLRLGSGADREASIAALPIVAGGKTLRLGDIAEVKRGYEDPPTFLMRFNGKPVIGLAVSMAEGGDILALGEGLDKEIAAIKAALPAGIEVEQVADQPRVVNESIGEFTRSLLEALAIVLAVSFVSLGVRTGIVVALSVPLVLAITFVVMSVMGIDLHRISLGALIIALGLLVDDAIIAVEMMSVKLEEGWDRVSAASYAYTSTAFPMLTGTLVTAAGFVPVGFAKSSAGEYTNAIFWVVGIALIVSWITAVIFTPFLGHALLPEHKAGASGGEHAKHDPYNKPIYVKFRAAVAWTVAHNRMVIAATVVAFVLSVAGFGLVQQQFFPSSSRPELVVDLRLAGGSSIAATEAAAKRLEEKLAKDPDVAHAALYIGAGGPRFYLPINPEQRDAAYAQAVIMTRGLEARERVLARIQKAFDEEWTDLTGRVARLENGPPIGFPVQFRVQGGDPDTIRATAEKVRDVFRANKHVRDINFEWFEQAKNVSLQVDRARAQALGLTAEDLAQPLNIILTGQSVAEVLDGTELIQVVTRARPEERLNLENIGTFNISIATADGTVRSLTLDQVATLKPGFEDPVLYRRNRDLLLTVRADIKDGTQAPVVAAEIDKALEPLRAQLPQGMRIEVAGAASESAKAQASIAAVVPTMILIMLTILMVQLQSFGKLALVVLTAPLGLIGMTIALLLFNQPFGFVATLGAIALAGMIMRNSVILVEQIDHNIVGGMDTTAAIIDATVHRARPVILTAAAAMLAMIPLARSDFWGPMAVTIIGGLAGATILTLIVLPAMYAAYAARFKPMSG
ncbi:MAG: efflux RND transporter permease subunit [Rhodospirillaceae bacterium]|nr:efflux RND transporter permease subunit [Rhodospirillaceae bacterium]